LLFAVVARPVATEITPSVAAFLSTAASRLLFRLSTSAGRQKLLPTMVTAKVERLSIAFGAKSGCFIHGHSADAVFGHGCRFFHGHVSFLIIVQGAPMNHSFAFRSLKALPMTDTELRLIAAPAIIGLSNKPKNG
jgi:hypothetical protein